MKCVFCGGKVEKKMINFTYEDAGRYFIIEHVPAEVCIRCGEKMYSPEVTDEILRFAGGEFKPIKKMEIPVYDFAVNQ